MSPELRREMHPLSTRRRSTDRGSDAVYHATDGAVDMPLDATPLDYEAYADSGAFKSQDAFKSSIIAIDYKNTGYGGSSLTFTGNDKGCNEYSCGFLGLESCRKSYSVSSMPSGWNDVVSSSKGYASCNNKHYEHTNFGGSNSGNTCDPDCSNLGAMNDQSSSRKMSH